MFQLCIVSPDGGDYWPRGGSPYGNPDKDEAGAEGNGNSVPQHTGSSTSRKLGLGLGITFGVLAVIAATWFIHRWGVKRFSPSTTTMRSKDF